VPQDRRYILVAQLRAKPFSLVAVLSAVGATWLAGSKLSMPWTDRIVPDPVTAIVTDLVAVGVFVSVVGMLSRRGRVAEADLAWRMNLIGVALIAASALGAQGLDLFDAAGTDGPSAIGDLVFSVGCLVACVPIYQGLVHWIPLRAGSTDPGELLSGFSAFFVGMAIGNLLLSSLPQPQAGMAQWQVQASVAGCAATIILLGTGLSVAAIDGPLRDLRIGFVIAAICVAGAGQVSTLLVGHGTSPLPRALWLFLAATITCCVLIAPSAERERSPNLQATVIGGVVVLIFGVVVLTISGAFLSGKHALASVLAAIGVLGVSLRTLRLVQDLKQLTQTRREAMTDDLTDLPNRRALLAAIDAWLSSTRSTSLLIIDLDRFKAINDRYGHTVGDRVLQQVAGTFAAHLSRGALLARLGGDQFAVLLRSATKSKAFEIAYALGHSAIPLDDGRGHLLHVKVSIGVATLERSGEGGELLRRADAALDQARASGTGICAYDSALDTAKHAKLELIEDLHLALGGTSSRQEQIVVYFQPQLRAATGEVVGAEALVRWAHPKLGLLAPDRFIDLAEQNGLMPSLTALVMREATAQAALWRKAGHHLRVSVNLSATCLNDPTLLPLIDEVLGRGLAAEDLVLEVTETSLMTEPEPSLAAMKRLAKRGVGVSIDDYGTGYSSLGYLNDLPATELKIDRSFTARVVSDPRTAAIIAGTVELAHRLGIRIVAEGIEDEAALTVMKELGCDETQGYLHSRPLAATLFLQWLGTTPAESLSRSLSAPDARPVTAR
jgi:diguanylate cyclase (GGDEF)-like protein